MLNATKCNKLQAAEGDGTLPTNAPLTEADVRALVESILRDHHATAAELNGQIIGFPELVARLPLGSRSVRQGIKDGWIPTIRFPGGRKLLFDWGNVLRSLRRFEKGGLE